ncbi:MAG: ATP:cob(I)alamin adenosyltransferase [bacterium]|nr:ATP:cob(I)alamin adenosyltransferase [Candidatus Aquidulcis frankliniae]
MRSEDDPHHAILPIRRLNARAGERGGRIGARTSGEGHATRRALGSERCRSRLVSDELKLPPSKVATGDLFVVGAELATNPDAWNRLEEGRTKVSPKMLARINTLLASTEAVIEFPKDFVIPGSSKASSAIELARTIIRRAERWCVTLGREGLLPGEHLLAYLNRLADLLWLLARQAEKLEASATRSVSQTPVRD